MINFDYVRRHGGNIRIHGNGFIQIDLRFLSGHRIHVFGHPAIPRQVHPTPIHDHRFGFRSTILSGCLVNVMWEAYAHQGGGVTHEVCTYRAGVGEDTKLEPLGEHVFLAKRYAEVLTPEMMYMVGAGELHETFANEATITYMVKTETADITPRVLCRMGQNPDNAFDRHTVMPEEHMWEIVRDAFSSVQPVAV